MQDLDVCLEKHDVHIKDDTIVCWNNNSKQHPRNWNPFAKHYTAAIVIWVELYMTILSSSGAAASKSASKEARISEEVGTFAFVTMYLLGAMVGGVFCSPISEWFGRRTIYIIAAGLFGVASIIIAGLTNIAGVFVGRFFQGIASAIPATVAFGNFSDLYDANSRIWAVYVYTLFGMAGLALGPIYSAYITKTIGWRWVFWIPAIGSAISAGACIFIKESNADQLLQAKTEALQKETGTYDLRTESQASASKNPVQDFVKNNLYLPLRFLFTEPLVGLCSLLCATAFGLIYGLTESLTIVYTTTPFDKSFDETSASLSFIAVLIGEILNVVPRIYDQTLLKKRRGAKKRITPESKIRSFALACPALAIGLWIFAWTIPQKTPNVPWPVSMLGLVCIGFAANDFSYVLFGYITDAYGSHAASAVSSLSTARNGAGAIVPLFITQMYRGLGNNIATTIIASIATVFCVTPFLFLTYGEELRGRSDWAVKGDDALKHENRHMDPAEEKEDNSQMAGGQNLDNVADDTV